MRSCSLTTPAAPVATISQSQNFGKFGYLQRAAEHKNPGKLLANSICHAKTTNWLVNWNLAYCDSHFGRFLEVLVD